MAGARLLAENFFDTLLFTSHTITAEEEGTNHEVERVAGGRRAARDYWTATTAESETYIQVTCDRVRAANLLWFDRGHNLDGQVVSIRSSLQSAFTTYDVQSFTVPSATSAWGSPLDDGVPVRTAEGAVLVAFDLMPGKYWRIVFNAGTSGSGFIPKVVGAMLGLSWSPTRVPRGAFDDDSADLSFADEVSPFLQRRSQTKAVGRDVVLNFPLQGESEYSQARYHIGSIYWAGYPMLVVPDTDYAERAFLASARPGRYSMPFGLRNARELSVRATELDPKLP